MRLILALLVALLPFGARAQTIDYNIADQSGASFLTDINAHLGQIVRHNAGTTAPAFTFPYMVWVDTSGAVPVYKYRNAANSAWITAFQIDASSAAWLAAINTSSATITGGAINGTAIGQTTPAAGTFTALGGTYQFVQTAGTSVIDLISTGVADTHERTRFQRDGSGFSWQTGNAGGGSFTVDYFATVGASGVLNHSFRANGTERLAVTTSGITVTGTATLSNASTGGITMSGNILPGGGNPAIGSSTLGRFGTLFTTTAPNVSSDARLKHDIEDITAAECRVADRIEIKRYRLNSEDGGPWRFGAIAQEVIAAFDAEGLDWRDYAIVTGSEADTYGIAYDELQNLKLACM